MAGLADEFDKETSLSVDFDREPTGYDARTGTGKVYNPVSGLTETRVGYKLVGPAENGNTTGRAKESLGPTLEELRLARAIADPGWFDALVHQGVRGYFKGNSDELAARLGTALRTETDDAGSPTDARAADVYNLLRNRERAIQAGSEQHWPRLSFLANVGGDVASDLTAAALLGPQTVFSSPYLAASGAVRGFGESTSDTVGGQLFDAGIGSGIGYGASLLPKAPGAIRAVGETIESTRPGQWIVNSGAARSFERGASTLADIGRRGLGVATEALDATGDKLKNLGGWFKVNSLHPTPTNAEAIAALPGGAPAVGRELLERGLGGLTKRQTANDIAGEFTKASRAIDDIATKYDASGAAPVDISGAIAAGRAKAEQLLKTPTKKSAGKQLMELVNDYEAKFPEGKVPATEALGMKRELADEAYGASDQFKVTRDKIKSHYSEGAMAFERATDDALDKALGPQFEAANLLSRRLHGANQAAGRTAARSDGNQLVSLKNLVAANALPALAGTAGGAFGGPEWAVMMGLGTKYGSQMAARSLFNAGRMAQWSPMALRYLVAGPGQAPAAQALMSRARPTLADLLESPHQPNPYPALAMGDE